MSILNLDSTTKVKTCELSGPALDLAVARIEQETDNRLTVVRRGDQVGKPVERETESGSYVYEWWSPSRIWAQGGLIIERERIGVWWDGVWHAKYDGCAPWEVKDADAPLEAAMRCFVARKLGDEVEVPTCLVETS